MFAREYSSTNRASLVVFAAVKMFVYFCFNQKRLILEHPCDIEFFVNENGSDHTFQKTT